ncbi:MAG: zinc ABC transporter substrate-binding protein [Oscillospiraceae bacterium]|nr:zinc ABC transporter substrate-binding protein [Oscillospiraceae bacterium]
MKRLLSLVALLCILLTGCSNQTQYAQVAATTLPVYEFTSRLCQDTPITVTRLINEDVSCLHDYSLNVRQVRAIEAAQLLVISGAGLEIFLEDLTVTTPVLDASAGIPLLCPEPDAQSGHGHDHGHAHEGHSHDSDPHIWLSVPYAMDMARNICTGLCAQYPAYAEIFQRNLDNLLSDLQQLHNYGQEILQDLSCRDLITFHDGFGYLALAYDLHILQAVEEESGSEASARELIHLIEIVQHHRLPAIFTERSGSVSAASIISRETGADVHILDMAMAGDSYFDAMYHNFNTVKEALG